MQIHLQYYSMCSTGPPLTCSMLQVSAHHWSVDVIELK